MEARQLLVLHSKQIASDAGGVSRKQLCNKDAITQIKATDTSAWPPKHLDRRTMGLIRHKQKAVHKVGGARFAEGYISAEANFKRIAHSQEDPSEDHTAPPTNKES